MDGDSGSHVTGGSAIPVESRPLRVPNAGREDTPTALRGLLTWQPPRHPVSIQITPQAVFLAVSVFFVIKVLFAIWQVLVLAAFAMILASALNPIVSLMERRIRRGWAVAGVAIVLLAVAVGIAALLGPPIYTQTLTFLAEAPRYLDKLRAMLALHGIRIRTAGQGSVVSEQITGMIPRIMAAVTFLGTAVAGTLVVFFMAMYMLAEAPAITGGVLRLLPEDRRDSARRTGRDLARQVGGYLRGQAIASVLSGLFSFGILWILGIPFKFTLAALAVVLDVLPLVGVLVPGLLAAIIALTTISAAKALLVVVGYTFYHQLESQVIIPQVYGTTLRVSLTLIIISVIAGAEMLGIPGIVLALPAAAAVPSILRFLYEWRASRPDGGMARGLEAHLPTAGRTS